MLESKDEYLVFFIFQIPAPKGLWNYQFSATFISENTFIHPDNI